MTSENKNPNPDDRHPKSEPDSVEIAKPLPTPVPSDSDDFIDFGELDDQGSKANMSGPLSGTSVVSWADLVKAQAHEDASFDFGGADAVGFDSASDRDILKKSPAGDVEDEASALLADDEDDLPTGKNVDSIFALPDDDDQTSSVLGGPQQSASARPKPVAAGPDSDDHLELHARPRDPEDTSAVDLGSMAVIDLPFPLEEGSSNRKLNAATADPRPSPRMPLIRSDSDIPTIEEHMAAKSVPVPKSAPPRTTSWIVGLAAGMLVGVGGCAAAWLAGLVPASKSDRASSTPTKATAINAAAPLDGFTLLQAGEFDKALEVLRNAEVSPAVRVATGKARWLQYLRQCRQNQTSPKADGEEANAAKGDFEQADSPEGALWLGLMQESLGQVDAARKVYADAKEKYKDQPEQARVFQAALDRLETRGNSPRTRAANPAVGLAVFVLLSAAGPDVPEEAGFRFWEALKLAKKHEYSAAQTALAAAKKSHEDRRALLAPQGLNPVSDPLEEIFSRSCDELAAYWKMRQTLHDGGYDLAAGFPTPESALSTLLAKSKKDEAELKRLQTTARTVNDQLQQAKLDPADLAGSVRKLAQGKTSAETAAQKANEEKDSALAAKEAAENVKKEIEAKLTKAEAANSKLAADLSAVKAQLADRSSATPAPRQPAESTDVVKLKAEVARLGEQLALASRNSESARLTAESLAGFARSVRQKLQAPVDADSSEVLNALDAVIAVKNQPRDLPPLPAGFYTIDPKSEHAFGNGLTELRAGRYADAEQYFRNAVKYNDRDARYWYFLGLAETYQGKAEAADRDFRHGAEREQRNLPNPTVVNRSLERWPVEVRDVINRARARS